MLVHVGDEAEKRPSVGLLKRPENLTAGTTVLLFENLHRFLGSVDLIQAIARQAIAGKHNRSFIRVSSNRYHQPHTSPARGRPYVLSRDRRATRTA